METKKYPGYWTGFKRIGESDSPEQQDFLQIDEDHIYGLYDECVYQIIPHKEMWNDDGRFIGQDNLIVLYEEEYYNYAFNYAEDNDLESYCEKQDLTLLTIELCSGDNKPYVQWRNESALGDEEFETPDHLESWLKEKEISYIIAESTIIADLSEYSKILERKEIRWQLAKAEKVMKLLGF